MVNGYVTLDLASNNIYKESLNAIKSGKPIMVVDAPNVYFADTIAISGDDVVITKGGKTITINDANAVSSVGEFVNHLYALTLNVSDTYFTFFTTKASGLNNKELSENEGGVDVVKLTSEEIKAFVNAINECLNVNGYLLANVISDSNSYYNNFSDKSELQFFNENNTGCSIDIGVSENSIVINVNAHGDQIIIYEKQLF